MGLLKTVQEGLNSLLGGAKGTLDQTSSGLKSSVENFIGDVVIRSTFNRAKSEVLKMLEDTPPPAKPAQEPKPPAADAAPPVASSNDLMARLMGNFSGPLQQAAKEMATQLDDTLTNVGHEITRGVKRTVKSKVESFQADDIVSGLSQFLNGSLQKLGGEDNKENSSFGLNGTMQMFGWFSMAIGALLLTGLNQGILKPEPAPILHAEPVQEEAARLSF